MTVHCNTITELANLLRDKGDKVLNASSKLSLSSSLLHNLNQSILNLLSADTDNSDEHIDLKIVHDFLQQTLALKILPDFSNLESNQAVDIRIFKNLKLLEIRWLSLRLIKGLKNIRAQLEYLTCMHSLSTLNEVLESCGEDGCQGFTWNKLKEAVFSYNGLYNLDNSLEFTPWLSSLDLSHNNLNNVEFLSCLPNLTYLNLSYNKLENVPFLTGEICSCLKTLILHNNFIDNVREISSLINLEVLDLRNNCLLDYSALAPLGNLCKMIQLYLEGNPFCYYPKHRQTTVQYLNPCTNRDNFLFDKVPLQKTEKEILGVKCTVESLDISSIQLDSLCSLGSENTVIPNMPCSAAEESNQASDTDTTSSLTVTETEIQNENYVGDIENIKRYISQVWPYIEGRTTELRLNGMNDSGIVAENRPNTPSISSIGSAGSLTEERPERVTTIPHNCESDIEILSNPSESSIEVLHRVTSNIY